MVEESTLGTSKHAIVISCQKKTSDCLGWESYKPGTHALSLTHEASEEHKQSDECDGEDEEVCIRDEPVGAIAEAVHAHHGARVLLLLVHDVLDEHLHARGWDGVAWNGMGWDRMRWDDWFTQCLSVTK